MTLYDLLIKKGEIKGKAQMILALYDDNIGISQIARYVKITEEEVLKILSLSAFSITSLFGFSTY